MAPQTTFAQSPVLYNMDKWIDVNKDSFVQSSRMKMMHQSHLQVLFVGGPMEPKSFHLGKSEELFYMVRGSMNLRVVTEGAHKDIVIKEGEIFLLPSRTLHSPQRVDGTVGLCIEHEQHPSEYDCLRWYVADDSTEVLYEKWFHMRDVGLEITPILDEFHASEQYKTGRPVAGAISQDTPFHEDSKRKLEKPIAIRAWIEQHKSEIDQKGFKNLYDQTYQADVKVHGAKNLDGVTAQLETFVWQIEGSQTITINGKEHGLAADDTVLIPKGAKYDSRSTKNSYSLSVVMKPAA